MTLTVELPPELEANLRSAAARDGVEPELYVVRALQDHLARDQTAPSSPPGDDVHLLEKINEGLPLETWRRYHELKGKRDAATLTPSEHEELIALSDAIEGWNVRRLEFVAELACLRGIRFADLVNQLGISPATDA